MTPRQAFASVGIIIDRKELESSKAEARTSQDHRRAGAAVLMRRVNRLDAGGLRNRDPERMADDQLIQAIASYMPDPAGFLERFKVMNYKQQGELLDRLIAGELP